MYIIFPRKEAKGRSSGTDLNCWVWRIQVEIGLCSHQDDDFCKASLFFLLNSWILAIAKQPATEDS